MKAMTLAVTLFCAAPLGGIVLGAGPGGTPATPAAPTAPDGTGNNAGGNTGNGGDGQHPHRGGPGGDRGGGGGERGGGGADRGPQHPMDFARKELAEAKAFLRDHSPNRYEFLQHFLPDDGTVSPAAWSLVRSVQEMRRLEQSDPPLFDLKMKQIAIEDDMYPLIRELRIRGGQSPDPAAVTATKTKLRDMAGPLLDLRLAERQRRIRQLREEAQSLEDAARKEADNRPEAIDVLVQSEIEGKTLMGPRTIRRTSGAAATRPADGRTPATAPAER